MSYWQQRNAVVIKAVIVSSRVAPRCDSGRIYVQKASHSFDIFLEKLMSSGGGRCNNTLLLLLLRLWRDRSVLVLGEKRVTFDLLNKIRCHEVALKIIN